MPEPGNCERICDHAGVQGIPRVHPCLGLVTIPRGSHKNYVHPEVMKPVVISDRLGGDVKHYQEGARAPSRQPSRSYGNEGKRVDYANKMLDVA